MSDPIHLFVPQFRTDEVLEEIRECLDRGWTGLGYKTVDFESAWCEHTGLPHAHFLNSATSGLHLAVRLLKESEGWKDGDEIITTPMTFVSSNHAILYEGLVPVFADIDEHLCLDPQSVAERITPRTRAILFVGLGGNPGCWGEIRELAREHGLRTILDAAHMAGTWLGTGDTQRHAGVDADVSVFSFHSVKNLPTADSGMICFSDEDLDRQARKWTWLGINKDTFARTHSSGSYRWQYDVEHVGFKYHGNSVMAAMGLVALRYLEQDNGHRRRMAAVYDRFLKEVAGVELVPMAADCTPSRHLYQVLVDDRDRVMVGLNDREIYPGVHYQDNTAYRMYERDDEDCPRARLAAQRIISLPLHLGLDEEQVVRVAGAVRELTTP